MECPTVHDEAELLSRVALQLKSLDLELLKKDLARFVMMTPKDFEAWVSAYQKETLQLLSEYQKK